MPDEIFWEVHSGLPREGPGDNDSTSKAFALMTELSSTPRILDIACGPGMQTIQLAQLCPGNIVAVDTHQPFLDELDRRANASSLNQRITTMNASMFSLPFENSSFDAIWCEGALYMMGIAAALDAWKRLLKPRGYIVFTEPCFLVDELGEDVRRHWAEYPQMGNVQNALQLISAAGYATVGHFTIPEASWWNDYYTPMQERIEILRKKYAGQPEKLEGVEDAQKEIDTHRKFGSAYGYEFFVVQLSG